MIPSSDLILFYGSQHRGGWACKQSVCIVMHRYALER